MSDSATVTTPTSTGGTVVVNTSTNWTLPEVASGAFPEMTDDPGFSYTNPSNEFTYAFQSDGGGAHYVTDLYVHPVGDYCIDGTINPDTGQCQGTEWTSGRLLPSASTRKEATGFSAVCPDRANGRLFALKAPGERIEVFDLTIEGDRALSYNRAGATFRLPGKLAEVGSFTGGCTFLPDSNELILISGSDTRQVASLVLTGTGTNTLEASEVRLWPTPLTSFPTQMEVTDAWTLTRGEDGSLSLLDTAAETQTAITDARPGLLDLAIDRVRGAAYLADGPGGLTVLDPLAPEDEVTLDLGADVEQVAARDGVALVATRADGWELTLLYQGLKVGSLPLDAGERVIDIAEPGETGDFVVITHREETDASVTTGLDTADTGITETTPAGYGYRVLAPRPPGTDDLPALQVFLFAGIEEPFDQDYFDAPCTSGADDGFDDLIVRVEQNAAVLAGLGVPVVLGLTHNFISKAEICEQTDIFSTFESYGFEMGAMVHNKPTYSCTDKSLQKTPYADQFAESCSGNSPFYCDPQTSTSCAFQGSEDPFYPQTSNYCVPSDQDCYEAFLARYNEVVDRNIPGGARFIVGADRHGLWGFDWVQAYRDMAREGRTGFDITFFAQARAYSGEIALNDSREKNPAPWRPADRVQAWWMGDDPVAWYADSAYSEVVFFSGMPISTLKAYEWQASGMHMGDFLDAKDDVRDVIGQEGAQMYTEDDFDVIYQSLRSALNHRQPSAINTWYFHIHDLSLTQNLADEDGNRHESADWLEELIERIQTDFGDDSERPLINWTTATGIYEDAAAAR